MKARIRRWWRRSAQAAVGSDRAMAGATMIALALLGIPGGAGAQSSPTAWFGLTVPAGLGNPHRSPVALPADFTVAAAEVPAGENTNSALEGAEIARDLAAIVEFSVQDRAAGEQMWGRITGRPALARAVDWAAERFREIGLEGVEVQSYDAGAEMWWPRSWRVSLLADPAYGSESRDLVLESALPTSGSDLDAPLTAPLVFAGVVGQPPLEGMDVAGRVAVQLIRPERSAYSERGRTVEAARALFARGAVAVLNVIEQHGNMHVRDFSNCGGACFNLGGEDGAFLLSVLERARSAGLPSPRITLALEAETLRGVTGQNAVGVLRGDSEEVVIVNAHADGWFDGAGDNADGCAVLLALARHFADPENRPVRTLVFVVSGGHHSPGMNGPANFVRMNPDMGTRTVLVLNLEHVAQLELDPSDWSFRPAEQTMSFGISNESPYLSDVARRGMRRYGFRINPQFTSSVPGDLGGYAPLGAVRVQAIHSGPLYHTSGDTLETISVPGLERAARFFAYFLREAARAPREWLDPGASAQ